jgi:hypothetical protein
MLSPDVNQVVFVADPVEHWSIMEVTVLLVTFRYGAETKPILLVHMKFMRIF